MLSLANTTEKLRSVLKIGAVIAIIFFVIYLFVSGGVLIKNIFFPDAPTAPQEAFGQLPEVLFEQKGSAAINYQINTISGELPTTLPNKMYVYKIAHQKPDLLALQNARSIVSAAGFEESEIKISDATYQWANPTTGAVIKYDINARDFEIRSNFIANQNLLLSPIFPDEDRIKKNVTELLNLLRVNMNGLSYNDQSLKYYAFSGNNLVLVDNLFNAKTVRVNLYNNNIQNELGDFPFVYQNPELTTVTLLVSFPSSSRMIVLEGDSYNHALLEESSDYPIKSAVEAFEDLKSGQGYLFNPNSLNSIQITNVFLAYYLDKNTNEYAQPVFVFEGINAKAFIPAVKNTPQLLEETSR